MNEHLRGFVVFYRHKKGTAFEVGNPFTARSPFAAAEVAFSKLASPDDYTGLAVLDHSTDRIHLFDISHKPTLVAA